MNLVGKTVSYRVDGVQVFWGVVKYVKGGFAGVQNEGRRIDEAPISHLHVK